MRTNATLLAAQQEASRTPYMHILFAIPGPNVDFYTDDTPNRILSVHDWEEPYGGGATIRISNYNQYFADKNWKGCLVDIGWGYTPAGGSVHEHVRRLWILNQRDISIEGVLVTEFLCIDDWYRLAATELISAGTRLTGTIVGNQEDWTIGETITGSVSLATGKLSIVSESSLVVISVTGTFQVGENAVGATNSCDTLTAVTSLSAADGIILNENTTILNILKSITTGVIDDVTLDEDDPNNTINTYQPYIDAPLGTRVRYMIRQLLMMSQCGGRLENDDQLHILYLNTAALAQYTYDSAHAFYIDIRERAVIIPNRVIFMDIYPTREGDVPTYFGIAQDDNSVNTIGTFTTIEVNPTISSNGEAENLAEAWVAHRVAEANQGRVVAPMNCLQELYDMIQVTDTRANVTVTGRVGRIDRYFESGRYEIELRLGGLLQEAGAGMPGQPDAVEWDIRDVAYTTPRDKITLRKAVYPWQLLKAIQPYVCDITFTAVSKSVIRWAAGTITFADRTTHTINANISPYQTITTGWLYFNLADHVLHYTTSFADCVNPDCGLVAFVAAGSETGATALVWPAAGKVPLLNADVIACMTLSALTANVGYLNAGIIEGVVIYAGTNKDVTIDGAGIMLDVDANSLQLYNGGVYAGEVDILGTDTVRIRGRTGYDLQLESYDSDIWFAAGGEDVNPDAVTIDLGGATYYYDDINYSDLIDRTPSPIKITNALDKIKRISSHWTTKKRKGHPDKQVETFNKETLPDELVVPVVERDIIKAEKRYQSKLVVRGKLENKLKREKAALERLNNIGIKKLELLGKGHLIDRVTNNINSLEEELQGLKPPIKLEPQPGISMNATIGLLLSAIRELTDRIEKLEGG